MKKNELNRQSVFLNVGGVYNKLSLYNVKPAQENSKPNYEFSLHVGFQKSRA